MISEAGKLGGVLLKGLSEILIVIWKLEFFGLGLFLLFQHFFDLLVLESLLADPIVELVSKLSLAASYLIVGNQV